MASIANVITVSLSAGTASAARANLNVVALITSEIGVLTTANRYETYTNAADVATDFGSSSATTAMANAFFATNPNPIGVGGRLLIGFWRAASETVAASAGLLTGAVLDVNAAIASLQAISTGSFLFTVDGGSVQTVTGLDFRESTTLADVIAVLNTATTGGVFAVVNSTKIVFTSDTTGATSAVTFLSTHTSGVFVGALLGLSAGSGATLTAGAASSVLSTETPVAAITAIRALVTFYGATWVAEPSDANRALLATWGQANNVLQYDVFDDASYLEVDTTNPAWTIKLASQSYYRMFYSAANNRKLAASAMARVHTVNFAAQNSANTLHLKTLAGAVAEDYTQTVIDKAKRVGLDVYTTIKDVSVTLTSGANSYVDDVYNDLGFADAVQTDLFNLLASSTTKIPQTTRGVNQLVDQAEKTSSQFVRAGVFAPGTWTSPDQFGDSETFLRNIEERGFYVLAGLLSEQAQASRDARESPVLQIAAKKSGAIQSAAVIIVVNR